MNNEQNSIEEDRKQTPYEALKMHVQFGMHYGL